MTTLLEVYKCEVCGNIVEMVHGGQGELVCCGEPMVRYEENTVDAAREKHVPVYEQDGNAVSVTIGSVAHPMTDEHYIEWIEVIDGDDTCRRFLKPGEEPAATLCGAGGQVVVRAYCNIHGLWRA